jgi:hypothetical protein
MEDAKIIRRYLRSLEKEAELVAELRGYSKTEGGHLTEFGKVMVALAKDHSLKQAFVARLFDISPGAVSQHYNK